MAIKRVFLIVIDSFGIGELPDAADFGDEGSNTLRAVSASKLFNAPNLQGMGLFNIDGCSALSAPVALPSASFARMAEVSLGKDTTTGHWEIAGLPSEHPFPTYPNGFPQELMDEFTRLCGRKCLCNKPYSGTQVINDYGQEHLRTGALIVYTSADSVFQIAAHERIVPVKQLYEYCEIARKLLTGKHGVGRVIARPFDGNAEEGFYRTTNRHDFSLTPPSDTMADVLTAHGLDCIGVGKIYDIFAGKGINKFVRTTSNKDGFAKTDEYALQDFKGLCFVNLVDTDMLYGHRNDVDGYARAVSEIDLWLGEFNSKLGKDDVLIITADHGCDPSTPSTDHSREYVFMLCTGAKIKAGINLGTRKSFADISATILDMFGLKPLYGSSFYPDIRK